MMTDRLRTRPKTTTSVMTRASQLNYSVVQPEACWRPETNSMAMWSPDGTSMLGIQGSKCTPRSWQMSFGPHSGGFLPVLKAKTKRPTSANKPLKRYRSAAPHNRDSTISTAAGKITSTNTASLLDLNSIVPSAGAKKGVVRLYRENSLPVDFKVLPQPVLRYSHDGKVTSMMPKLRLFESEDQNDTVNTTQSRPSMLTNDIKQTLAPPSTPRLQIHSRPMTSPDSDNNSSDRPSPDNAESKWRLNVTIPNDYNSGNNITVNNLNSNEIVIDTEDNATSEINAIKEYNNPKSTSRDGTTKLTQAASKTVTNDVSMVVNSPRVFTNITTTATVSPVPNNSVLASIATPSTALNSRITSNTPNGKETPSVILISTPTPPTARPQSGQNRKRVIRPNVPSSIRQKPAALLDTGSDSEGSSSSAEPETDSSVTHDSSSIKTVEVIKSVRFAEQPARIKEYYPWEPPQNSIVFQELKQSPHKVVTKTVPVFRP